MERAGKRGIDLVGFFKYPGISLGGAGYKYFK